MRYVYLLEAVRVLKPKKILEVGTWNGHRAKQMLSLVPDAKYYGFDLFEDANEFTDAEEKNVKPHHTLAEVKEFLLGYDVKLYKGNTRETLAKFNHKVDFAWIDGGHSVETIRSDWENVKRCLTKDAAVYFDDFYSGGIDTSLYGCNEVVKDLDYELLPAIDPVNPVGGVQIARVFPWRR